MRERTTHVSVMSSEVVGVLADIESGYVVDGTIGQAGHALEILKSTPESVKMLALDRDPEAIDASRERLAGFDDRVTYLHRGYDDLVRVLDELGIGKVRGILLDLGLSSTQLDSDRGLSFEREAPLDMRFDQTRGLTAAQIVRRTSEKSLARSMREIGQVPSAGRLARRLKEKSRKRHMETTSDLVDLCREVFGPRLRKVSSATLPAMVLRILTNGELERLDRFLSILPDLVADGGVTAILSFHSGEDGRVKWAFRDLASSGGWTVPFKKGLTPSDAEVDENRRARSARLRVLVREGEAE